MTVSSSRPELGSRGGLLLKPLAAAVNVSFALPRSSTYISVLLTPRVRLVQLLANIVGLASVLGAFGVLFGLTEDAHKWCSKKLSRGRGKASPPAASATGCAPPAGAAAADAAAETATPTGSFRMENPMRRRGGGGGDGGGNGGAPIAPLPAAAPFDEPPPPALMFPSPAAAAASAHSAAARGRCGDGDAAPVRPQVALSSPLAGRAAPLRSGFAPTAAASARAAAAAAVVAIPVAEAPPPAAASAESTEAEAAEKAAAAARGGAAEKKSALQTLAERAFSLNELPPGWDFEIASARSDNSGGLYFILPSGETSWDDPRADWEGYWRAVRAAADEGADLGAWELDFPVEEEHS